MSKIILIDNQKKMKYLSPLSAHNPWMKSYNITQTIFFLLYKYRADYVKMQIKGGKSWYVFKVLPNKPID